MKRNILSVLLACLMIVSLCLMVGCKTDDLEAQIIENDAKQEGAVSDAVADLDSSIKSAADTAAANLAEAQKKLEGMIASGDAVDAAALNAAIADYYKRQGIEPKVEIKCSGCCSDCHKHE